jgi:hypothetical protein
MADCCEFGSPLGSITAGLFIGWVNVGLLRRSLLHGVGFFIFTLFNDVMNDSD